MGPPPAPTRPLSRGGNGLTGNGQKESLGRISKPPLTLIRHPVGASHEGRREN
jgi:hypothetical protein